MGHESVVHRLAELDVLQRHRQAHRHCFDVALLQGPVLKETSQLLSLGEMSLANAGPLLAGESVGERMEEVGEVLYSSTSALRCLWEKHRRACQPYLVAPSNLHGHHIAADGECWAAAWTTATDEDGPASCMREVEVDVQLLLLALCPLEVGLPVHAPRRQNAVVGNATAIEEAADEQTAHYRCLLIPSKAIHPHLGVFFLLQRSTDAQAREHGQTHAVEGANMRDELVQLLLARVPGSVARPHGGPPHTDAGGSHGGAQL